MNSWRFVQDKFQNICERFGYKEIRTPVFEYTELFQRGVGDTTDVVQKEMYTFTDKGDRSVTLRPEGTAGAVRAYLENGIYAKNPINKLFYNITCYRHEKPQAGRLREFHQFGIEAYGAKGPGIDAEIISLAAMFLKELSVTDITININSIGCPSCRREYNKKLREYLDDYKSELCETCLGRLEKNPLRVLDCKSPVCSKIAEGAPMLIDYICDDCKAHFEGVKNALEELSISYNIDPTIVRGLDYYTKTVFEIKSNLDIGSQRTICGGGRYDGLIETLGGTPTPGIGFGLGIERLLIVMEKAGCKLPEEKKTELFIGYIGEEAGRYAAKLAYKLRGEGRLVEYELLDRSVKAQMKYADKLGAKYSIVLGSNEIQSGLVNLKNMETGETKEIKIDTQDFLPREAR
ncbi:MAG: histidine--tRNA ligase [Bacillota bacterium]|nr:histidine--tRNA ligase [Bacillota bacterium]